jgi:beta-lactamase superfamily II metal-dependent hydrolase
MSYVVRIWHAGRSILIPGDIEEPGWRRLVERSGDLRADVLVASHHGRRSGYFEAAVDAISPTFVVVSTGPLAAAEDAHRLYRARVLPGNFYSTRSHGTICIRFHDTGWLEIVPERRPPTRSSARAPSLAALLAQRPPVPPSPAAAALARLLTQRRRRPLR